MNTFVASIITDFVIYNVSSFHIFLISQLLQHLNNINFITPQGERFFFQGADTPAKYDLVNWQKTPEGSQKTVLIGHVDGFNLHFSESVIQWSTGSNQVSKKENVIYSDIYHFSFFIAFLTLVR